MGSNSASRKRALLSGGIASLAAIVALTLWVIQSIAGIDLGLTAPRAPEHPAAEVIVAPNDRENTWYQVYFTNPQDAPTWEGGLDKILIQDIDLANASVEVAAYDLDLQSVTDALIRAHKRGVQVRMVTDSDNVDLDQPQELIEAGIPVIADGRSSLMHNKFVIVDRMIVWTGSWNLTDNGTYRNNNNITRIASQELAENYGGEFNEMFVDQDFGNASAPHTPLRRLLVDGTQIETYFAPEDQVMNRVIELVSTASQNIRFLAFSFTEEELATTMLERAARGVVVEGVFEARGAESEYSQFPAMKAAGLNVRPDGNPASMHHKVIVIDNMIVMFGSFNLTRNANRSNDENLLIVFSPDLAALYLDEFNRVMAKAKP